MPANPNAVQVRIEAASASKARGQRAHDLRIGPQPKYVDKDRTHLNRVLIKNATGAELREICEKRRAKRDTKRAMKSNAAVCFNGIITFGHAAQIYFDALSDDQKDEAYRKIAEAIAERLGTTLHGLVHHGDETSDHAHFQLAGFALDGTPVTQIAKWEVLRDLQSIAATVISKYDPRIERGTSKKERLINGDGYADTVHKSGAEMRELLGKELPALRKEKNDLSFRIKHQSEAVLKLHDQAANAAQRGVELREHVVKVEAELDTARTKADEAEASRIKAQSNLERTRQKIAALEQSEQDVSERLRKRERDYEQRVANFEKKEAEAHKAAKGATERLEGLRSTETRLTASVGHLEVREGDLRTSVSREQAKLETLSDAVAQKKTKANSLTARLRTLNAA